MWNPEKAWINLRSSLWFIPAVAVTFAIILAVAIVEIDLIYARKAEHEWPRFFAANPEGARAILGAIATSTITVAGVIFSIVTVALSISANQYTPRILRTFMRDRATQSVLGVFVGVFTFSLIVLRTVRAGEQPFVPVLGTNLAIALALLSIGCLVFFIHHIASSIQAPTMISKIAQEAVDAIEELFPEQGEAVCLSERDESGWIALSSPQSGYLQNVSTSLIDLAEQNDFVIRVERKMGEFVICGTPLLSVRGRSELSEKMRLQLVSYCSLDSYRTVEQDPSYGIQLLVDIALKALSPGVNDTSTGVNCVDYLGWILFTLVQRAPMPAEVSKNGKVRLIYRRCLDMQRLTDGALLQIRQSAKGNPAVLLRLLKVIAISLEAAKRTDYKLILAKHISLVEEVAMASISSVEDRTAVAQRVKQVRALVPAG